MGRPKGAKNKIKKNLVDQIIQIAEDLDAKGKGLKDCATQDPGWFYTNFLKGLIPKNVSVTGEDGGPIQAKVEVVFVNSKH